MCIISLNHLCVLNECIKIHLNTLLLITLMNTNDSLKKCSRCKCTILLEYFSKNRKGDYFKCCDNCKKKHSKPSNIITADDIVIAKARSEYIQYMIDKSKGEIRYIGPLHKKDVPPDFFFNRARHSARSVPLRTRTRARVFPTGVVSADGLTQGLQVGRGSDADPGVR